MQYSLKGGRAPGNEKPAPMNGHTVHIVRPVKATGVFRIASPSRVILETGHHPHAVAATEKKIAQGGVVRANSGQLGRVVDSPNRYVEFHIAKATGALCDVALL